MPYLFKIDGKKYACLERRGDNCEYPGSDIAGYKLFPEDYASTTGYPGVAHQFSWSGPFDGFFCQNYANKQWRTNWDTLPNGGGQGNISSGDPPPGSNASARMVLNLTNATISSDHKITGGHLVLWGWAPEVIEVGPVNFYKSSNIGISSDEMQRIIDTLEWVEKFDPDDNDPFGPGGTTGDGGGGGDFDNTSTPIDIPSLPTISASITGFISLYNPSLGQLVELSSYLWSDLFEIDGWKKLFADPMDAILGLSILPVAIPSGGTREVKVGNIGTGISLTVASSQFVEVDCGSIDVNEYWGAYLDYEPYTQAQIFLPYIGTRPISVDEIMGKTVRVVYHVDILTGACCCFVKCGDSVLYTYNGQCSIPIPITGANYTSVVNGVISIAASVGSLVATGGASAPTAIPAIASSAVNQIKPQIEKSGSISGSAGVLNMQIPYLILIRPRQALPSKQNQFIGYPSLTTVQLTELSGYTEVQSIHLENIPATQEELAEIQSLLEGGVIF